jgi:hypothetical protein
MPAHQCLWPHEEDIPAAPWQQPTHRGKQQPIVWLEARVADLAAKDRQLVPEHEPHHPTEFLHPTSFPIASAANCAGDASPSSSSRASTTHPEW